MTATQILAASLLVWALPALDAAADEPPSTPAAEAQEPAREPGAQADAYWDAEAMRAAREALKAEHGDGRNVFLLADRFEYRSGNDEDAVFFEGQARWGTDENRLWLKTEIGYDTNAGEFGEAELQALWSKPVSHYFDVQLGLRQDFEPGPERTYAVAGVQGLAPYWFEVDAALFVSSEGKVSARLEGEYDLLITQRLVLQPRLEIDVALQDDENIGIGSGVSQAEAGLRLRYEFSRQFAPYIGVNWSDRFGKTADFARASGGETDSAQFVVGLRAWF